MADKIAERHETKRTMTGVILAGGASRRMGRDKALLELAGRPLLAGIAERVRMVADEVIIATNRADLFGSYGDRCVADLYPEVGTLGGIHAGLMAARHERVLIVGCDMPFLQPALLAWFADVAPQADLVVLRRAGIVEPLHAVYHKRCLPIIERTIQRGERCAFAFYPEINVHYVVPEDIAALDPELFSFRNVNTPEEYLSALREINQESRNGR